MNTGNSQLNNNGFNNNEDFLVAGRSGFSESDDNSVLVSEQTSQNGSKNVNPDLQSDSGENFISEVNSELSYESDKNDITDKTDNSKSDFASLNTTLNSERVSNDATPVSEASNESSNNEMTSFGSLIISGASDTLNESNQQIQSKEELSSESDGNSNSGFDIPLNNGPVFNSPMDCSEIKNVTHNNSSELSLLISALEEQQKRTVTTLKADNSEYSKKLDAIFNPDEPKSDLVPKRENLSTTDYFNQKFSNVRSVIDSKQDIVLDVEKYLSDLTASALKLTSGGEHEKAVSNVSKSIEGISSIVADLTSAKRSSSDLKSALSKLPSFDENGNIIEGKPADNYSTGTCEVNINGEESGLNSDLTSSDSDISSFSSAAITESAGNESSGYNAAKQSSNEVQTASSADEIPFELTPQKEELSIDEAFAQAQREALAQLEQDKELEKQLKEDAERLNQSFRDSAVNIEKVINHEDSISKNTEDNPLGNEDEHYIQNIDDADNLDAVSVDSNVTHDNSESTHVDLESAKDAPEAVKVDSDAPEDNTDVLSGKSDIVVSGNVSADSNGLKTAPVSKEIYCQANYDSGKGTAVIYVAGYFDGKNKEVSEVIPARLESLANVLSLIEKTKSDISLDTSVADKAVTDDSLLSGSLSKAVEASLNGNFGPNVNAVYGETGDRAEKSNVNSVALTPGSESSSVGRDLVYDGNLFSESDVLGAPLTTVDSLDVSVIASDGDDAGSYSHNHAESITAVDDDDSDDDTHIETVRVSDLKAVDNVKSQNTENNIIDGNPKILRESTLKLIEAEQQFENRRLGRKLEPRDFYYKVEQTDPWFQTILKSGYNDGPVFSALCYSKRIMDPTNEYNWKLQISNDFELMIIAPDFHHNLRTRFSFVLKHPVEIELESYRGIPPGCPEELARMWFVQEIENAKREIANNGELNNLLIKLGENIRTLNISIYTQKSLEDKTTK